MKNENLKIDQACMFWNGKNHEIAVVGIYGGKDQVGSHYKKDSPTSLKYTPFENCAPVDEWIKLTKPKKPAPWYENIPKTGCLARNVNGVNVVVYQYQSEEYLKLCTPLTPEEAMNLIYQAEEETPKLEDKWLCFASNGLSHIRTIGFYDKINQSLFFHNGNRGGGVYNNYEPIPRSQWPQWAIEAHKTLED